jgi:hypothetical protein
VSTRRLGSGAGAAPKSKLKSGLNAIAAPLLVRRRHF